MEIRFLDTKGISEAEWASYCEAFNQIFERDYTFNYFWQKYQVTIDGCSYHSLLLHETKIVGACTVIPYLYIIEGQTFRVGLVVDVFILNEYRDDPYSLFKMYKLLKNELVAKNIAFTVAVPNDIAYPFWKNIVKWKDVGLLSYYTLPVKMGNVLGKHKNILNALNRFGIALWFPFTGIFNFKEKDSVISIDRSFKQLEEHRYTTDHQIKKSGSAFFSYRIMNEKGVITCYLIDFFNTDTRKKDTYSLRKAISAIIKNPEVDLIVFVGQLRMFQSLLLKVPYSKEPKHLYFMADVLMPQTVNAAVVMDINNWDFGLYNFDVR